MNYKAFLTNCNSCGQSTSKAYARAHSGKCKQCETGIARAPREDNRNAMVIDHGWQAYAREEGHYDLPDYA